MRILMAAVLCAVVCLTSISFSISSIQNLFTNTAAELLGGDRVIAAPESIPENLLSTVIKNSTQYTQTITFYSMISNNNDLMLSLIKAVEKSYPLYGTLKISQDLEDKVNDTYSIPAPGTIWVEPRILLQMNAKVGDIVSVGNAKLKIAAVLRGEPDRVTDGFGFVPRAIMNIKDVPSTQAVQPGSRVTYKLLFNATQQQLDRLDVLLKKILPSTYELRSAHINNVNNRNLDLANNYLWLAIIINFILAAIAILISANCYTSSHLKDAAILRCLGASRKKLITLYVLNLSFIALILGVLGGAFGFILQQIIISGLNRMLDLQVPMPGYSPLLFGIFGSLVLVVGVALPSILQLTKISPMQALRQDSIFNTVNSWQIRINVPKKLPVVLKLSLNNIVYNARYNLLQVLAFALIICVALVLFNVRSDLLNNWFKQLPQNTPNYFAINIVQSDQHAFNSFLHNNSIQATEMYPIVRGMLVKINQQLVSTSDTEEAGKRTGIHRPLNLTWTMNLPVDNTLLQGEWFKPDNANKVQISIENDMAKRLNVGLGDELTFLINMREYPATITSIRSVKWGTFTPNFYVIYSPGILEAIPHTYMVSFHLSKNQQQLLRELIKQFPSVNILSVTEIFDQANVILNMLSLVVAFIWMFTLIIGVILLMAVIVSGIKMRNYQNNLMRILGASKSKIQSILALEYLILGAFAGLVGSSVAIFAAKVVSQIYFQSTYTANWWTILAGIVSGALIMLISGIIGTNKALGVTPVQYIRELNN